MPNVTSINPAHLQRATYQRDVDLKRVARLAESFVPSALGAITVSQRTDGSLWVIDGSHRTALALQIGLPELNAIIYDGLTEGEEAALFLELNDAKAVDAIDKYHASVVAGFSAYAAMDALVKAYGWKVKKSKKRGEIAAVSALEFVYSGARELPEEKGWALLDQTLRVVTNAWGLNPDSTAMVTLRAIAKVLGRYGGQVDEHRLIRQLQATAPHVLLGESRGAHKSTGIPITEAFAQRVVQVYNTKIRKNTLPRWEI